MKDLGQVSFVFSVGRSGSTWLGSLVSAHPRVAYRFEPSDRHAYLSQSARSGLRGLGDICVRDVDWREVRASLLEANPRSDKPPYFAKPYGLLRYPRLRHGMWAFARSVPPASLLFRGMFGAPRDAVVVAKFVAHESLCRKVVSDSHVPVSYLVRHPCGVVASILAGQRKGVMPTGRRRVVARFLQDNAPELYAQYAPRLSEMPAAGHEALLWRWSVGFSYGPERVAREGVRLVFYENLCLNPREEVSAALGNMGLSFTPEVEEFVARSIEPANRRASELGVGRYFSVFRDPVESANRWKSQLSSGEVDLVTELVREAPMYKWGVAEADWA